MVAHDEGTPVTVRVLVADDEPAVVGALADLLAAEHGMTVVATAADGTTALLNATRFRPDVAIVDLRMPDGGAALVRALLAAVPEMAVIALSAQADGSVRRAVLDAGASSLLLKGDPGLDVPHAIRAATATR